MLRSLLQELNKDEFETYLAAFQKHLSSAAPDFTSYFCSYSSRMTEWAYCHRVGDQQWCADCRRVCMQTVIRSFCCRRGLSADC